MDDIFGNKFLIANAMTYGFSKNSSEELDYDFFAVYDDIARSIKDDIVAKNFDRRAIAVGADPIINGWEVLSGTVSGWREAMYISGGLYHQMIADLIQPTTALVDSPDVQFDFVLDLNRKGVDLTFINNDRLYKFESFVLTHPEYNFTGDYTVIEYEELESITEPQFDLTCAPHVEMLWNPDLVDKIIDATNSGGAIMFPFASEGMRLYSETYYIEPVYDVYEALDERTDITSYHIPYLGGFHIIVKK